MMIASFGQAAISGDDVMQLYRIQAEIPYYRVVPNKRPCSNKRPP